MVMRVSWGYTKLLKWIKKGCNTQQARDVWELNINYRYLSSLPDEICSLTNLRKLNCSQNVIKHLPNNIGNLVKLYRLDVSHNELEDLPESMSKLINLNYLSCKCNPNLSSLYEFLPGTRISVLLCDNCNLTFLPNSIGNLTLLSHLNCNKQNLYEILGYLRTNLHMLQINGKFVISPHTGLLDFYRIPSYFIGLLSDVLLKKEIKKRQTENRELQYLNLVCRNLLPISVVKYNIAPFLKKQTKYQMTCPV